MQRSLFRSLLRVKLPHREVGLLFKHNLYKDKEGKPRPVFDILTCKKPLRGITFCEIYKILGDGDVTILVCGRAYCKMPDRFDKKIGRKRALTSALRKKKIGQEQVDVRLFSKEERDLIWTAYWEKVIPMNGPLHPYGPIPPVGDMITEEGHVIQGE